MRDAILAVSGRIDLSRGGPPEDLADENVRRTLYGKVDRTNPDPSLALFDFPDSKAHSPERDVTVGPSATPLLLEQSVLHPAVERPRQAAGHGCRERAPTPASGGAYQLLFRPPAG